MPAPTFGSLSPRVLSPRLRWFGLAILTVPVILTSMDITILHIAIPTITHELAPSLSQTLWILDAYGFLLAGLLIVMGNIGDRIGRRRLLLIGAAVFCAASMLAAFAPTPEVLIAGRALMGIGGATLMPSTLSLIRNMFTDPTERTRAIGIWTASLSGGIALGPIIGGLLLEAFWWGAVFLINVPIIVLLLVIAPRLVPEYRSPVSTRLDLVSVLLSFAAILPIVWAIKAAAEQLVLTGDVLIGLAVGILAGAIFLARQRRLQMPLVDVGLFANPRFSGAILGAGLAMFSLVGVMLYNAQYLQLVEGLSPLVAALAMLPVMVAVGGMAVLASVLVRRFGYPLVFGAGAAIAAAGMLAFSRVPTDGGLVVAVVSAAFIGAGIAPMMTLATDVVVGTAPPHARVLPLRCPRPPQSWVPHWASPYWVRSAPPCTGHEFSTHSQKTSLRKPQKPSVPVSEQRSASLSNYRPRPRRTSSTSPTAPSSMGSVPPRSPAGSSWLQPPACVRSCSTAEQLIVSPLTCPPAAKTE